jgi:peptide/nickel transport system substrate-binding protein
MAGSYWDKFTRQRISRRRMLQSTGVAGAAAGAVWLVGCGDDDNGSNGNGNQTPGNGGATPGATEEVGAPVRGGRYQVASTADFDTFDPHLAIAASVGYFPRLYNVLVNFSALDSEFRFDDLSTEFEQPDDTTYVFTIRPNVMVGPNDLGVPERALDANDVVASYERIKTLPASNAYGFVGQWIETQEASSDGMTYTLTTPNPYYFFRNRIGSAINTVIPREALEDGVVDRLLTSAAGAGAFTLRPGSYTEGQGAALDANPNYYRTDDRTGEKVPYIEGIDVKIITARESIRTAFIDAQLDSYGAQNVDEANDLQSRNSDYQLVRDPVNTFISFTMNPTVEPWTDERIRKAAMHAIDRQEYIDRVYSGEAEANGLFHWPLGDLALPADERDELQKFDPELSKQLIREATGQDTIDIRVMWPAESTVEEHNLHLPIWLQQMERAGFNVQGDPQDFGTWLQNYTDLNYEASLALNQIYEYAEFNMDFHHSEGPARNGIYTIGTGGAVPAIDAEIDRVKGITDPEEFRTAAHDLQRQIYEAGPTFLPLVSPYSFTLYQPWVKNIPRGIGSSGLFLNTWWLEKA